VVITDEETLGIGMLIAYVAGTWTSGMTNVFIMEDLGQRPVAFHNAIKEALEKADVSIYAAQGVKGELQTFRMPMFDAINANPKLRHAHMSGVTMQIMKTGMCANYQEVKRISTLVYEKVKNAEKIRVITEKGTAFTVQLSPELRWIASDGDIKPGFWKNLPDGEVFTCPYSINGRAVIDGCLGDFFTKKYGSLENTPVTLEIRAGKVKAIDCDNFDLAEELKAHIFGTDENSERIGEFAIGTNVGLTELIYNLLQDEKFPGVHIAAGSPNPKKTGANWDSRAHVDGIIKNPTIWVDDKMIMETGKFLF
jgi:leucyl aminopeptidase (aminopeptidase T)